MTNSVAQQLADHRIDGGLEKFVRERRQSGESWRLIAIAIRDSAELDLTPETVRGWFIDRPWARPRRSPHRVPAAPVGRRGRVRRRPLDKLEQRSE